MPVKQYLYKFIDTAFREDKQHVVEVIAENVTDAFADANLDSAYVLYEVKPVGACND